MSGKPKSFSKLCILDCLTGARIVVEKTPFTIGANAAADFRLIQGTCPPVVCTIVGDRLMYEVKMQSQGLVDGEPADFFQIVPGQEHSVTIQGQLLSFKHTSDNHDWQQNGQPMSWRVYDQTHHLWSGPLDSPQLIAKMGQHTEAELGSMIVLPALMENMGFFVHDLKEPLSFLPRPPAPDMESLAGAMEPVAENVNSEYGEFTCPICWFKFDRGDAMNIAVHGSLRGDPILGEDRMQRFHATRFNDRGQALDAMGLPSPDLACPHCRRKLPPGFMDSPHHIFSIVGAPSSGKSYYLSVLVKLLQSTLFQQFRITFRDADPSENVILTQMKTQLFSAASPEDAFLAKTELEGSLYETLPRQGRKVRLPKPFVFRLSHPDSPESGFSIVFYDNAGEHFEPTANSADSPGAQHISVASGIFFLFDPLHNTEFRHKLAGITDPQIQSHRLDQQDVILAETEVRMKSILGMDARQRVTTPLAVMVGKCDTWLHLLGPEPLQPAVQRGWVSLPGIQANSARIRALLMEICPAIIANAEAISSNVCYFAISPLGCSPVQFKDREGHLRIGPDPKQIKPQHVEEPTLWVLSQTSPDVIPSATDY
ncbi:hypothetical protein EI77_01138 [Prosthecobacter fusiformis]|uniref:Uncharacterized protein n=1 Tax=Prosthecobacter fusiformis TaxID=48464 RepID=A0A4R7SU65_9BACT|nr:hypothetical protein [Prosthecobacter fusiformis]TDU81828.1 hypothetical protein EI77_01138 [Prosthecobacter fusiformis]